MTPKPSLRKRRRPVNAFEPAARQTEAKESSFFGSATTEPFFAPQVQRAAQAGEEKKLQTKADTALGEEKKEEKQVQAKSEDAPKEKEKKQDEGAVQAKPEETPKKEEKKQEETEKG